MSSRLALDPQGRTIVVVTTPSIWLRVGERFLVVDLFEGGSRCPHCQRGRDSVYNSTRKRARARATIAASPRCENCGATADLTADHLIPVIDGGANGPLRTLCRSCNSRCGDSPLS